MLFSSTVFLFLFLPIVLFVYYVLLKKWRVAQNVFLLFSSLFFYAWGEPKFVLVMLGSIIANWLFGIFVNKYRGNQKTAKLIVALDVAFNLAILFVFKYLSFTGSIIDAVFGSSLGINIALPIGISFFTFQAMSYVIDVYRDKAKVQKNILYVGLYISFFPQLIAGPIVRYETVAEEIINRKETVNDFFDGFARFIVGLAKKVLLANTFALLADKAFAVTDGGALSVTFAWLGALAYTFQIFFDFSGYSDMAIGLGKMFGFHFSENFNYPYISSSVTEFWRRWHISLGTWFRDYVYIPLGGNRVSKWRNVFNLFVVWSLTGIWHGANFTFIIWGLMYFLLLVFEKFTGFNKKSVGGTFVSVLKHVYTLLFVILGWVLFRSDSIGNALTYMGSMFGFNGNAFIDGNFSGYFMQNIVIIIFGVVLSTPIVRFAKSKLKNTIALDIASVTVLVLLFVLCVASLVSSTYNPFIYFNF